MLDSPIADEVEDSGYHGKLAKVNGMYDVVPLQINYLAYHDHVGFGKIGFLYTSSIMGRDHLQNRENSRRDRSYSNKCCPC